MFESRGNKGGDGEDNGDNFVHCSTGTEAEPDR